MASSVGKRERGRRRRVDGTVAVNRATYARDWNLEFVKFKSQIPNPNYEFVLARASHPY